MVRKAFTSLLLVLGVTAAIGVGCGEHVVVPNDKSGKCVAGLLTKCGDTCVDTQTSLAHCGACGTACTGAKICAAGKCTDACPPGSSRCGDACVNVDLDRANCGMCGKACTGTEVCAKGKCVASCEAVGYSTCAGMSGPVDAGAAMNCVDSQRDNNNCGACGNKCMTNDQCSNGVCCGPLQRGCGGQCVSALIDANNCGGCGVKCGMVAPNCVLGACSKCNNKLLVLSDAQTSVNNQIQARLQSAGFAAVVVDNGRTQYSGMPAASEAGAIVILPGSSVNGTDMPMAGQSAIAAAQAAGVGIVLDGYAMLEMTYPPYSKLQAIRQFALFSYSTGAQTSGTVQNITQQLPYFAGVPGSFGTGAAYLWYHGSLINNAIQDSQFSWGQTYVAGLHRSAPNGRLVQLGVVLNTQGGQTIWQQTFDPMLTWVLNNIRWAAGCTN